MKRPVWLEGPLCPAEIRVVDRQVWRDRWPGTESLSEPAQTSQDEIGLRRSFTSPFRWRGKPRRTGAFVLILVLVVVAMLSLSAYTFCHLMLAENESALLSGQQLQARCLVDSAASHVHYFLELDPIAQRDYGGVYANPQLFRAQLVVDHSSARSRGRFGVIAPAIDSTGIPNGIRFGLEDESTRLNINALDLDIEAGAQLDEQAESESESDEAPPDDEGDDQPREEADEGQPDDIDTSGRAMLLKLPGMTINIADAILDWIDEDDEPREYGAEIDYYSGLSPPYTPPNGPLQSIEELLLVRGVTADLLFGRDVNRNRVIDASEFDLPIVADVGRDNQSMEFGWASYLTLWSKEKNVNQDGEPRVQVNNDDLEALYDELSAIDSAWATFIVAYRQNGLYRGDSQQSQPAGNQSLDLERPAEEKLDQLLDLVDVRVEAELAEGGSVILESPFSENDADGGAGLVELMDQCTVNESSVIPGRININQAPRIVLLSVPGMTTEIADSIISQRDPSDSQSQDRRQHAVWILADGLVTLDEMRTIMPYVTTGGDVFRAQLIGYFDAGEISSRAEVIFDATSAYPGILSWKDMSHLGRGFPRELLGIEAYDSPAYSF